MLSKLTPQLKYVFRELEQISTTSDTVVLSDPPTPDSQLDLLPLRKELTDFFVAL